MGFSKLSVSLLALAGTSLGADMPSIVAKGSKFFYENGTQFFMKGVAYQQDTAAAGETDTKKSNFKDPLADEKLCKRDVPLLKELGTNTIRTYAIDPEADHSACMKLLQEAGIYVVSDLSQPKLSINRDQPTWDADLFNRYKKVVDELGQYPNVIGFFAGNEVSNNKSNTDASAFVKAAVRDTKAYIKKKGGRWMGVGYAANDDDKIRDDIAHYFNCGTAEDSIDFWGYNIYSWCGDSNLQKSGYDKQAEFFKDYSVPVFFAEYGCNNDGAANRKFTETTALYGKDMTPVFSGGIVYMYFQEDNDFGLVKASGSGSATKLKDFNELKKRVTAADPKGVDKDDYTPKSKTPKDCPKASSNWAANSVLPPTPNDDLCECMVKSRSCVPDGDLEGKDQGKILDFICGDKDKNLCAGINGNGTLGVYGAYSMCNSQQRVAYALDAYYNDQKQASDACSFKGQAKTQKAEKPSSCTKKLDDADKVNEAAATATTPVGGGGSDPGSSAGGDSKDDDEEGAAMLGSDVTRVFTVGGLSVGLYAVVAGLVGVGMVAI